MRATSAFAITLLIPVCGTPSLRNSSLAVSMRRSLVSLGIKLDIPVYLLFSQGSVHGDAQDTGTACSASDLARARDRRGDPGREAGAGGDAGELAGAVPAHMAAAGSTFFSVASKQHSRRLTREASSPNSL